MGESQSTHEIIKTPKSLLAWVYLHSENGIYRVYDHWHLSLEITLFLNGIYHYKIGNKKITTHPGDILVINPGTVHSCHTDSGDDGEAVNIIFPYEFLQNNCKDYNTLRFCLDSIGHPKEYAELASILREMYTIVKQRKDIPHHHLLLNSCIYRVIFLLVNYFSKSTLPSHSVESQRHALKCERIVTYLDENYSEPITLEAVAEHFGLSREHFARMFKNMMGTTFKKYLTSLRMYYAYEQLTTTDLNIIDIAMDQGFPDSKAFINCFKELYGMTPLKYRKAHEYVDINHKKTVVTLY